MTKIATRGRQLHINSQDIKAELHNVRESKRGGEEGRSQKRIVKGTAAILHGEGPSLVMARRLTAALMDAGGPWPSMGSLGKASQVIFGSH